MKLAPIVLFIYNRPNHTKKTLQALSSNILAEESELFVFADGAKENASEEQLLLIKETRSVVLEKKWCKNVTLIESPKNKGLAASVIHGVTEIVEKYGRIIVLEDDLVTSPYFLQYMNTALDMYEMNEDVISIHGYMFKHKKNLPQSFFIKGADCWGWATWKRGWNLFNSDSQYLLDEIKKRNLSYHFNFNNTFGYTDMLQHQIDGKISSWAIRWLASAYINNKLTLYPSKSLVQNIGMDGSGRHCGKTTQYDTQLAVEDFVLQKVPVVENIDAFKVFVKKYRMDNIMYHVFRIPRKLKRMFF